MGDFVLVPSADNAANPSNHSKIMVNCQGPYEIVDTNSEVEFVVRLLGDTKEAPVY